MNRKSVLSISSIIGISLLSLGALGISRADAQVLARGDWSQLSPEARNERVEKWRSEHKKRAQTMEKLLEYLELDADGLRELRESRVTLKQYVEENGYDLETVKSIMRQGMLAHLDELKADGKITEQDYKERVENIDEHIDRRLNGDHPATKRMIR